MLPIIIGRIGSAYGIHGWVKIISHTEPRENIFNYHPWQIKHQGKWHTLEVLEGKRHGNGIIAHIKGYNNPEAVRQIANADIGIARDLLPALPKGEYYWADLIGLNVVNTENSTLGTIAYLFETGSNDVIVVQDKHKQEILIPYLPQVVLDIDLEQRIMCVDWE